MATRWFKIAVKQNNKYFFFIKNLFEKNILQFHVELKKYKANERMEYRLTGLYTIEVIK